MNNKPFILLIIAIIGALILMAHVDNAEREVVLKARKITSITINDPQVLTDKQIKWQVERFGVPEDFLPNAFSVPVTGEDEARDILVARYLSAQSGEIEVSLGLDVTNPDGVFWVKGEVFTTNPEQFVPSREFMKKRRKEKVFTLVTFKPG